MCHQHRLGFHNHDGVPWLASFSDIDGAQICDHADCHGGYADTAWLSPVSAAVVIKPVWSAQIVGRFVFRFLGVNAIEARGFALGVSPMVSVLHAHFRSAQNLGLMPA